MQFFTLDAIVFALVIIRKWGFTSKSRAEITGDEPTGNIVYDCVSAQAENREPIGPGHGLGEIVLADLELAKKVVAWAGAITNMDNYFQMVKITLTSEKCGTRDLGVLAAGVNSFLQDQERINAKPSSHVGQVGERLNLTLTVKFMRDYENDYGGGTMVKFNDEKGNDFVWFSSKLCDWDLGQVVNVKATIKAHDEFKGRAQTVLNRVRQ